MGYVLALAGDSLCVKFPPRSLTFHAVGVFVPFHLGLVFLFVIAWHVCSLNFVKINQFKGAFVGWLDKISVPRVFD